MTGRPRLPDPDWIHGAATCAGAGIFAIDADHRAVMLDPRAGELLGLAADRELAFDEYLAALDPADREPCARAVDDALATGGDPYHDEFRTGARRWIAADGRTRRDRAGRIALVGLLFDVTLRRTTDDARSRLVDEMARALRFNDMLIGVVAHDLRSPLAAVSLAAELLQSRLRDPQLDVVAGRITGSAERMSRIVDQLLELTHARLDGQIPLRPVPTDVAVLIRELAAELTTGDPPAAIEVVSRGDTTCVCDPDRLGQVCSNLLGNAVRHSPGARDVRVMIDGTGPGVTITVTNPGAMTPDLIPTLFNPFRRRRSDRTPRDRNHGLGLGLYIARQIVQGHGGDITVRSADDVTAFRVELPRATTATAFSLNPERADEDQVALQRLATDGDPAQVTAAMFGVVPIEQRAPEAFATLVERQVRILGLSLARQIYRDARASLATELRELAEQLGALGGGAGDVAELHSQALQRALKGAPAIKVQALVGEGRLIALELMGRLVTYYRKRAGFASLTRGRAETPE